MDNKLIITRLRAISTKMDLQTVTEESQEIYTLIDQLTQDILGNHRRLTVKHYLEQDGSHSWKVYDDNVHCGYVHYLDGSFGGCLFEDKGYDTESELFDVACLSAEADYKSKHFGGAHVG